jgi:hypothetical protein
MPRVTVAAVILAPDPESALQDAEGVPAVRRIVDSAWAGGALPIVVVSQDRDGRVAAALAGTAAILTAPASAPSAVMGSIQRGIEAATAVVREIEAALVWPVRLAWVGPETVTSLIEAHGATPGEVLRPSFESEPGLPVLVPLAVLLLDAVPAADPSPDLDAFIATLTGPGAPGRTIDLGDPGTRFDVTVPQHALPPYTGPVEPASGRVHEWGAAIADASHEGPLEGPGLAPWGQAGAATDPDQPG